MLDLRIIMIEFSDIRIIPMMNDQETLTDEARDILSGFIKPEAHYAFMNEIRKKPKSEWYFFIFSDDKNLDVTDDLVSSAAALRIINCDVDTQNSALVSRSKKSKDTHRYLKPVKRILTTLSAGAIGVLTELRYGAHGKFIFPRLGEQSIDEMDLSIQRYGRYCAVSYPGIENAKTFHHVKAKSFYLSLHDKLHIQIASTIANPLYEAWLSAINLVREKTKIHWSKEIWNCLDMEFIEFVKYTDKQRDDPSNHKITEDFLKLLSASVATEKKLAGLFSPSPFIETTWLLLIDLVVRRNFWLNKNIDPDFFPYQTIYGAMYQFILKNSEALNDTQTPAQQVFNMMQLYFSKYLSTHVKRDQNIYFEKPKGNGNYIQLMQGESLCFISKKIALNSKYDLLYPLFYNKIVSLDELATLSNNTIEILQNNFIFLLITNGKLLISQLDTLPRKTIDNLQLNHIAVLFSAGKISLVEVGLLSDKATNSLLYTSISSLVGVGRIAIKDIDTLSGEMISLLGQQNIYHLVFTGAVSIDELAKLPKRIVEQLTYYTVSNLVKSGKLSANQLFNLSNDAFVKLRYTTIHKLFSDGELSIEQLETMPRKTFEILVTNNTNRFFAQGNGAIKDSDMDTEQKHEKAPRQKH